LEHRKAKEFQRRVVVRLVGWGKEKSQGEGKQRKRLTLKKGEIKQSQQTGMQEQRYIKKGQQLDGAG